MRDKKLAHLYRKSSDRSFHIVSLLSCIICIKLNIWTCPHYATNGCGHRKPPTLIEKECWGIFWILMEKINGILNTVTLPRPLKTCIDLSLIHWSTAPCPPSSLAAAASCGTNRGTISWQTGEGAQSYTANVVGNNGHTVSCTSNTTSCSVKLECGLRYTATVVSAVGFCNRTANNSIQFDSGNLKH